MNSSSAKKLPGCSTVVKSHNQLPVLSAKPDPKKQIQATLNELHQLQSELHSLNVPQNPHSSSPVKKQIKNLSYIYQNMTKPKIKNSLNIQTCDIKSAIRIMNEGVKTIDINSINQNQQTQTTQAKQINLFKQLGSEISLTLQSQNSNSISLNTLQHLMQQMYDKEIDLSIINETKLSNTNEILENDIYKFINYSEFDNFDPLKQAYNCLLDDYGKFSFKRYNQINEILGLPKVKELEILKQAVGIAEGKEMTFEKFKQIIGQGNQLGFI